MSRGRSKPKSNAAIKPMKLNPTELKCTECDVSHFFCNFMVFFFYFVEITVRGSVSASSLARLHQMPYVCIIRQMLIVLHEMRRKLFDETDMILLGWLKGHMCYGLISYLYGV